MENKIMPQHAFKVGDYYYEITDTGREFINYIKRDNEHPHIRVYTENFYLGGNFYADSDLTERRFATQEEIEWLNLCIAKRDFISKKEIMPELPIILNKLFKNGNRTST